MAVEKRPQHSDFSCKYNIFTAVLEQASGSIREQGGKAACPVSRVLKAIRTATIFFNRLQSVDGLTK